jgi:aminoglycoside phosphotransferase (APT) family kinase protein
MPERDFVNTLKRQGYEITEKKLGGGFVNDVRLVTAKKEDQVLEYVLKKYGSNKDAQDMLRGYDVLSASVKTPTIVYRNGTEIAYDFVRGKSIKSMITEGDPNAKDALKLLGRELEKLHQDTAARPKFKYGDSPDEKKMILHAAKALERGHLSNREAHRLVEKINKYIPKAKSFIHGDAHLGNFHYVNGELYFLDPDNVKMSDPNADLGKVTHAIDQLAEEGKITSRQRENLREVFLENYQGEDAEAVKMYEARTPLIVLKKRAKDPTSKTIRKVFGELESRVAIAVAMLALIFISFSNQNVISGKIIEEVKTNSSPILTILIVIVIIAAILLFRKRNKNI